MDLLLSLLVTLLLLLLLLLFNSNLAKAAARAFSRRSVRLSLDGVAEADDEEEEK